MVDIWEMVGVLVTLCGIAGGAELDDLENIGSAVEISMLSCLQAEI